VIVAGLAIVILALTAATGMICYRSRSKTSFQPSNVGEEAENQEGAQEENAEQNEAQVQADPVQSLEHLVHEEATPAKEGGEQEDITDESVSPKNSSEE